MIYSKLYEVDVMFILKKNKNMLLVLALIPLILLSSCHSNVTGHQIVGVWEHHGNRIEFTDKGYFKKGKEQYPFTVNEKKVTIDNHGEAMVLDYSINSNGTLTMNGLIYYPVR